MKKNLSAFVFCSILMGLGNAEASFIAVSDKTGNGSFENARNLHSYFGKTYDADIQMLKNNSTFANISNIFVHVSVKAITGTGGAMDWYSLASAPAASTHAVPVPSAVWLFGSGLFALLLSFKPKKSDFQVIVVTFIIISSCPAPLSESKKNIKYLPGFLQQNQL
jgi:hypothetical protein